MSIPRRNRISLFLVIAFAIAALLSQAADAAGDPLYQRLVFEHAHDRPVIDVAGVERAVETKSVDYAILEGESVSGYMARPADAAGPTPALLVIHEWWGLNDDIRAMTRRLAANGYTAMAVDLYGGETADSPEQARALMEQATAASALLRRNLREGFLYLDVMPSTERVGSIGWRFGGGWSLRTALMFPDALDAAVVYYGELITETDELEPLSAPVLGHFGSDDSSIPLERVREFDQRLDELDKPHEVHVYDGAGHAFANPSGTRYAEAPAEQAWQRTIAFLERTLRPQDRGDDRETAAGREDRDGPSG